MVGALEGGFVVGVGVGLGFGLGVGFLVGFLVGGAEVGLKVGLGEGAVEGTPLGSLLVLGASEGSASTAAWTTNAEFLMISASAALTAAPQKLTKNSSQLSSIKPCNPWSSSLSLYLSEAMLTFDSKTTRMLGLDPALTLLLAATTGSSKVNFKTSSASWTSGAQSSSRRLLAAHRKASRTCSSVYKVRLR